MPLTEIFKNIIDATRLVDARLDRLEAQVNNLNTKITLLGRQLDALRAKLVVDGWEDVKILTDDDVVEAGVETRHVRMTTVSGKSLRIDVNSNAQLALPSTEELFAGLDNIIR